MARKKATAEDLRRLKKAREFKRKKNMDHKEENVCAICDNGGSLVCCDGGCQRAFHLDNRHKCIKKLGLTKEEAKNIIENEAFVCKNCRYKQHQCYICGSLGSSDATSSQCEVFQCQHVDCARFYHPKCVAQMLYPPEEQELFELHIAARMSFTCPMHECVVCKKAENKNDENMQFAVCRRCPTAYHRKCLPREIIFEEEEGRNGAMARAWDGFLADRILIYCMKHEISRNLKTPERNHIIFPEANELRSPMEQDMPEEEKAPDHSSEQTLSLPPAESDQNQCSCSSPLDSFAPSSLFMHPHPGSCGWIDD